MGGSDLGKCANIARVVLFLINIVFTIFGVIILAVGIWAITQNRDFTFLTGNAIIGGAALLIVCGIVTIIISVLGIIGAIFKLRPILVTYAAIIFIIVVLEVVAAIVVFVFSDAFQDEVEERVLEAIGNYRTSQDMPGFNEDINDAIDTFQTVFDCCGWNNASDWINENPGVVMETGNPPSCENCTLAGDSDCTRFENTTVVPPIIFMTTGQGCNDASEGSLRVLAYSVGGLGIAFGIVEIFGIILALLLCCCITTARKEAVV